MAASAAESAAAEPDIEAMMIAAITAT